MVFLGKGINEKRGVIFLSIGTNIPALKLVEISFLCDRSQSLQSQRGATTESLVRF